ncbi:hypothetical protein LJR039_003580 [Pseudorhodoferax sp. LjRoot39]|uniref:hypothetical protein n=1 Tax=Pseudorhodoferax sp. LjRoot39 TaxID=3342328 RepID=UPI003ED0CC6B
MRPAAALLVGITLLLGACAGMDTAPPPAPQDRPATAQEQATAAFYLQYAVLAADVYTSETELQMQVVRSLSSPLITGDNAVVDRMKDFGKDAYSANLLAGYLQTISDGCRDEGQEAVDLLRQEEDLASLVQDIQTMGCEEARRRHEGSTERRTTQAGRDCGFRDVASALYAPTKEMQWKQVPELQKYARARSWAVFVPHLKIDVWYRARRTAEDESITEYAIVFRGTAGSGGWLSNLRGISIVTPFIYDHYLQARKSTAEIIRQIEFTHKLKAKILGKPDEKVLITAVGHSLGGGLAQYAYLTNPQITRVVGFNPSPVNGASTIPVFERRHVNSARAVNLKAPAYPNRDDAEGQYNAEWLRRLEKASEDAGPRTIDADPRPTAAPLSRHIARLAQPRRSDAAIFLLYERGEILTSLFPCASGAMWAAGIGPVVACDAVNYQAGSSLRQHDMGPLVCGLAATTRSPEPPQLAGVRP